MAKIRVLLANRPLMLREWLRELINSQSDMEVVGEESNAMGILRAVGEKAADVAIIALGESDEMPGVSSHLMAEYPHLVLLGISRTRDRIVLLRSLEADSRKILGAIRTAREP